MKAVAQSAPIRPLPRAGGGALVSVLLLALTLRGEAQDDDVVFLESAKSADAIMNEIVERRPRRLRQVGTTSVTLRMDLGDGLESAFKPRTRTHPRGYLAEIAAYRIARALEMDNVPPVIGRGLPRPARQERFESSRRESDWEAIRQNILWDAPGEARGAAIYWIPRMRSVGLETARDLQSITGWLQQAGELPEERSSIARDLSTMIAFDYLIGNWDRWSGGNVSGNAKGDRLFVRDHNLAFIEPLQGARYERIRRHLEQVERFSRGFIDRVALLDEPRLRLALAADPESEHRPILDESQIAGVLARRRALLSYVGALVKIHGSERVFVWP